VQQAFLRGLARQTWRYFEVLVNAQEHWLPPDNFQEVRLRGRRPHLADHIGLALLATWRRPISATSPPANCSTARTRP